MQKILQALETFDGKQTEPLVELAASVSPTKSSIQKLIVAAQHDQENVRVGATWVFKHWQEQGTAFSTEVVEEFVRLLDEEAAWGAQLHLLQMLDECTIPKKAGKSLLESAGRLATSDNKFVRAWAVSAVACLADQHVGFRQGALDLLAQAEQDSAASVKARMRKLVKRYTWLRDC